MFNNRFRHEILKATSDCITEVGGNFTTDIPLSSIEAKFPKRENKLAVTLPNLAMDGYLHTIKIQISGRITVKITEKGVSAITSEYFLLKNRQLIWDWFKDGILLLCNVGIATAAIIALRGKNQNSTENEIRALQSQLTTIEKRLSPNRSEPNNMPSLRTNSKDSSYEK